ncbi:hypothetical protein ACHAXT_006778 [Thalassiosira profunda]
MTGASAVGAPAEGGAASSTNALNSTPYLQSKLTQLRNQSQELSSELTKKLATSRSGQSLLHIGPSLSTLPPDLSSLLDALSPLLQDVQQYESDNRAELDRLVTQGRAVQCTVRKRQFAVECAEIYRDLVGAEEVLRKDVDRRMVEDHGVGSEGKKKEKGGMELLRGVELDLSDDEEEDADDEELDHASSLERAAYTTLYLLQELQISSQEVAAITMGGATAAADADGDNANILPSLNDTSSAASGINGVVMEKSRFLMKLAPRIRRLESDTAKCLVGRLESLLAKVRHLAEESADGDGDEQQKEHRSEELMLMIGHCLRGLALLGKGADAESAFARVAIMPIIRSKLSMGKLDEGGSRGECAGLFFLLDDIANTVRGIYGPILRTSEGMFSNDTPAANDEEDDAVGSSTASKAPMDVDLVTCGVWVPVATALMADPGIKMAIFSPGIANVLQANYSALDTFLSELASNLLTPPPGTSSEEEKTSEPRDLGDFSHLYYRPKIDAHSIERAQSRLYAHPTTVDYYKRWNLPIYYQLRFAEFTKRLDKALELIKKEGWHANAFTGDEDSGRKIREALGFELPLFVELYDSLLSLWKSTVFLRPLTHRFLRGAVQLVGRVLSFVKEGLDGAMEFGGSASIEKEPSGEEDDEDAPAAAETIVSIPAYHWNERCEDLAAVAWELTILETCLSHDYLEAIANTICPPDQESRQSTHNSTTELDEIKILASEVLMDASRGIPPLVERSWNALIVDNLTSQCSNPLSAVKGVAATYRMTNRPPPTQASPFVATILKPLKEFDTTYSSRTPPQIGEQWKEQVVVAVSDKYSVAVEELIATVKRTEEALKSRKTRRMMVGGMSDGEKVKLQLYLDHKQFKTNVEELGVDAAGIAGLVKLGELTQEAESLFERTQEKP